MHVYNFTMNNLPCRAINFVNSEIVDKDLNDTAKRLVHLFLVRARCLCGEVFLSTALEFRICPRYISDLFNNFPIQGNETRALQRKLMSLKMEMLNHDVHCQRQKAKSLLQELGYCYLKIIRRTSESFIRQLLKLIVEMLKNEERIIFERHSRKWKNLTHKTYPLSRESYQVKHQPCFCFRFNDIWWPSVVTKPKMLVPENRVVSTFYTNDSDHVVPENVNDLLAKGPRFRVPLYHDNLLRDAEIQLEVLTYKLRYNCMFENLDKVKDSTLKVPFPKNSVSLPEKMNRYQENSLSAFKREVMEVVEKEIKVLKKDKDCKDIRKTVEDTKKFLMTNNLVAVRSDKTNRMVITNELQYRQKSHDMLKNTDHYKWRQHSKSKAIETQANRLIRNIGQDKFDKGTRERLISTGSKPANFVTLVKDHKTKTESGFPLRPVASTTNTPTNKIDWLISRILNQLLRFIPSYIKNTEHLIQILNDIDKDMLTDGKVFVSLDVVNLYPSIPIDEAITAVLDFAKTYWHEIDNYGLSIKELQTCLSFVSYNYEVQYEDQTYLQIKGCPMGAHFSPPFAIIFMHNIEAEALSRLKTTHNFSPTVYARYIDDVILGPVHRDNNILEIILKTFNAVNRSIDFTMEVPKVDEPLNYLDISISIHNDGIEYEWYQKACHSGIILRKDSHLPQHVKNNFINQSVNRIEKRCSSEKTKDKKITKFADMLRVNGYDRNDIRNLSEKNKRERRRKKVKAGVQKTPLVLSYINEKTRRRLNQLIDKYDIGVRLVSKPPPCLDNLLQKKRGRIAHDCRICKTLGKKYNCKSRYVVYKFTCSLCAKAYVGQTARPFYFRYREHKYALDNKNKSSALSEHVQIEHNDLVANSNIDMLSLEILESFRTPVESRIGEAMWIRCLKPAINRRQELTNW